MPTVRSNRFLNCIFSHPDLCRGIYVRTTTHGASILIDLEGQVEEEDSIIGKGLVFGLEELVIG